jgi:hypothetical protein
MPRPAYKTLGQAITSVMDAGGTTTIALADQLRERGWKPDQSLVSKWRNGHARPHNIDIYPDIEDICGVPRGTIFRLAGYVDDVGGNVDLDNDDESELWGLRMPEWVRWEFIKRLREINAEPPPPAKRAPVRRRRGA